MTSMRVLSRNVVKRASLVASTTAGALAVGNLQSNDKSKVWRAVGTSATITGTLPAAEAIACMHLTHCNLTPAATWRIRLYSGLAGTGLLLDTGNVMACQAPAREPEDWTPAQAASAYSNGGGAHAFAYFTSTMARSFTIDIIDTANLQGYIEAAAALVAGTYWEPVESATGASMTAVDSTVLYRSAAGGQLADAGTIHRVLPIELGYMLAADRAKLVNILMSSRASPILVDLLPGSGDLALRRDMMIYGRRAKDSEITLKHAIAYGSSVEVEEI